MRIERIINQHRRHLHTDYEFERCGYVKVDYCLNCVYAGNVIHQMCTRCRNERFEEVRVKCVQ